MQDLADVWSSEPESMGREASSEQQLEAVRAKAVGAADALMLTDAPLLFPPGQLALAALRSGVKSVRPSPQSALSLVCLICLTELMSQAHEKPPISPFAAWSLF